MKLKRIVAILLIVCLSLSYSAFAETLFEFAPNTSPIEIEDPDFRNTKWGMTKNEVIAQESGLDIYLDEEHSLAYKDTLSNFPVLIIYSFDENDILKSSMYVIEEEHSYAQYGMYIANYSTLKESLIKKYGKLKETDKRWINTALKSSGEDTAFTIGALAYYGEWKTKTTKITIILHNDTSNNDIYFGIMYNDINYKEPDNSSKF